MPQMYLYQDKLMPKSEVRISPEDRGYYFGDGVYEVFRVYKGKLYEADAHFARLSRTASELRIALPNTTDVLSQQLDWLIQANELQEGTVYLQITRGAVPRSHPFPVNADPILMAYTSEIKRPLSAMQEGITAVTMEDIRWLRCDLKTLNLLPNVMAKQHAVDHGAGDVILHRNGRVTECSASNIMLLSNGIVQTHPADNLILHGITRAVVLRLARAMGIEVKETPFTVEELLQADEAFITGTTVEVTPIITVDGRAIRDGRPGAVTLKLQQAFELTIPF